MKIYTRTGDDGVTGLFGGGRVSKHDARIEAFGAVDELNAVVGVARAELAAADWECEGLDALLDAVQHHLFDLGAELATRDPQEQGTAMLGERHVKLLEEEIDRLDARLEPLKQFILPGGARAAAQLHLARCVCRRAERLIVALARRESVRDLTVIYVNRLSDLLFVAARAANQAAGVGDVPWNKRV